MERQQYSFSWANHSQFAPNAFRDLFGVEAFSDVTLACSDGQQLYGHRIILSSCSPFFRNLLLKNPHKNTLIYLKGISSTEMQAILKFIYQGSCEVGVDELKGFLEAGKELLIEGLQEYVEQRNMDESWSQGGTQYDLVEDSIHSELFYSEKVEELDNKPNLPKSSKKVKARDIETNFHNDGVDEMFLENTIELEPFVGIKCNECSYKAPDYLNLKRHKEKIHETNVSVKCINVQCKECDYTAIDSPNLKQHELEMHASKNITRETRTQAIKKRYSCDLCDFQANFATNFKKHMENAHTTTFDNNGAVHQLISEQLNENNLDKTVKYTEMEPFIGIKDDKGRSTVSEYTNLKKPKEEIHENNVSVALKCKECDFTALGNPNLRQHEQEMHTNKDVVKETSAQTNKKRYNCDKCDYQANFATSYKKHMENTHKTAYNIFKWSKD